MFWDMTANLIAKLAPECVQHGAHAWAQGQFRLSPAAADGQKLRDLGRASSLTCVSYSALWGTEGDGVHGSVRGGVLWSEELVSMDTC